MKILLIDPPFYRIIGFYNRFFPFGITSIATALQKEGHDVVVYDMDCNNNPSKIDYTQLPEYYQAYLQSFKNSSHPIWQEALEVIKGFNADVVGIAVWTPYAASAFHMAKICKQINSSCPVVVGGAHATVKAHEILDISPNVDYVIRGEGEVTISELIRALESDHNNLNSIQGLSFRYQGNIRHNPERNAIKNLDDYPFPDRSLLINEQKYTPEDMGLIMTSRGCPFVCSYCATHAKKISYRSIDHIINEIKFLKEKYHTTQITFKDDSFTVNKRRVKQLCDRMIIEKLNINWECNTRVDLVTEELVLLMKKAGCNSIKVGIESGSRRILQQIHKGITLEQIRSAAELFKKIGIYWTGYFLMGVPDETIEDVNKTLEFMYDIAPDFASIGVYEPYPGTSMFNEAAKKGLVKPDMTIDEFYTILPNNYYKIEPDQQVDIIEAEKFSVLEKEIKRQFHSYNKDFRKILKRAISRIPLYTKRPRTVFGDLKRYLNWR